MNTMRIEGTAHEIGAQLFTMFCAELIRQATDGIIRSGKPPEDIAKELAGLWGGFIGSASGMMAAEIGPEGASTLLEYMAAVIPAAVAEGDAQQLGKAH